jgi:lipoprotein-anchoring transpeptidase ErfK/SrfK
MIPVDSTITSKVIVQSKGRSLKIRNKATPRPRNPITARTIAQIFLKLFIFFYRYFSINELLGK